MPEKPTFRFKANHCPNPKYPNTRMAQKLKSPNGPNGFSEG